jgi:hypothetical protein
MVAWFGGRVNGRGRERMSKPAVILLIVMFELGILFAGQAQTQTVAENLTSVHILAPLSASGSLHSSSPDENRLPAVWDITIDFLSGGAPQACLTRSTRHFRQVISVSRGGSGVEMDKSRGSEMATPGGQPVIAADGSPLASLSSLSPPGLILRL